jgi:hypothetical protein
MFVAVALRDAREIERAIESFAKEPNGGVQASRILRG